MEATQAKPLLVLAVKFGSLSITDCIQALGFNTPRAEMALSAADATFVDRLIECRLVSDPLADQDAKGQQTMGISAITLDVVCGSVGVRVSAKQYSGRLIFGDDCDVVALKRFVKRHGSIEIKSATPREEVGA